MYDWTNWWSKIQKCGIILVVYSRSKWPKINIPWSILTIDSSWHFESYIVGLKHKCTLILTFPFWVWVHYPPLLLFHGHTKLNQDGYFYSLAICHLIDQKKVHMANFGTRPQCNHWSKNIFLNLYQSSHRWKPYISSPSLAIVKWCFSWISFLALNSC